MVRSLQRKLVVWMRAVTVTGAVLAILVSAFAMTPEIDHRLQLAQTAVSSGTDSDANDNHDVQPAPDTKCHVGHGCITVIMPGNQLAFTNTDGAPEFFRATDYPPFLAGDMPFHPPRILSQV